MTPNRTEVLIEIRVGDVVLTLRDTKTEAADRFQATARYPDGSELVVASDGLAEAERLYHTIVALEQTGIFDD